MLKCTAFEPIEEIPVQSHIPSSDMPGDKVLIQPIHLEKANYILSSLPRLLDEIFSESKNGRIVLSICGNSGSGKTESAALLVYALNNICIGAYAISGDNYPHRIPKYNDAERLGIFRIEGTRELIARGIYTEERQRTLAELQKIETDASPTEVTAHPWLAVYQQGGDNGLRRYLGTQREIDFAELSAIVSQFKNGADEIFLKRMGREDDATWYEAVSFKNTDVLIVEWTHGNNDNLRGIDVPIMLYNTPEETLAHRKARGRDSKADSPFVTRVLNIETELLLSQAHKAKLIISGKCEPISIGKLRQFSAV